MGVTSVKVGKKMVERELEKDEIETFYNDYTFKRRHTKKFDQEKKAKAIDDSIRIRKEMHTEEN